MAHDGTRFSAGCQALSAQRLDAYAIPIRAGGVADGRRSAADARLGERHEHERVAAVRRELDRVLRKAPSCRRRSLGARLRRPVAEHDAASLLLLLARPDVDREGLVTPQAPSGEL